ncbi:oligosaccharide repeat unit polymerase [Leptospira wolbachii]|nr:oligosaccharide repeat unit polymerase [Leptospira wolbachii]
MSTEFTVREYRSEVFGLWTGSSKLFHNSKMISIFYFWIVNPFQVASVFLGVSFRNIGNDNRLFYVAILLLFFDAIILAGRFALHSLISVFLITLLLDLFSSHSREFFYRKNKYLFLFIGFILFFLMVFTMLRDNSGLSGFVDSLKLYIFIYHTESFSILDHELLNPSSIIHDLTYGKSFFGGVLKYPILLMNQLGFNIISEESRIGGYLHKNFAIGINEDGSLIQLNAFGSIFFSMYRDGREFFIFLCGIFYGYNLLFFSQRFYSRSVLGVSLLVSMLFIGIYGIFQPYIDGAILPSLLISSIILIVLNFYYKRIV